MENIKTYEDACKALKQEPVDFTILPVELHSFIKLTTIAKALNEGWTPDWSNSSQYKYTPYFYFKDGVFSYDSYDGWGSGTSVPSRLCFKSSKIALYCAQQFADLWNDYLRY